jgi:uncharacterized membrane protein
MPDEGDQRSEAGPQQDDQQGGRPREASEGASARPATVDAKTGGFIAYFFWWVSGLIMLFVGRNSPELKFHAAQSVVVLGGLTLLSLILEILFSFFKLGVIGTLVYIAAIAYWIVFLVRVVQLDGARFEAPLIGRFTTRYVEELADSVK